MTPLEWARVTYSDVLSFAVDMAADLSGREEAAEFIWRLRAIREALKEAEGWAEQFAAEVYGPGVTTEGEWSIELVRTATKTTWDRDRAFAVVCQRAFEAGVLGVPADQGEKVAEVVNVVTEAIAIAARLEFRAGGLRSLGIDPEKYVTREGGRMAVRSVSRIVPAVSGRESPDAA